MTKVIPTVAIPMIVTTLIDAIYNLADTFFVSELGKAATAAVAVNDSLMHILRAIAMGFAMGAASYISRLMGAKQDLKGSQVATTTLVCGCLFSMVFGLVCFCFKGTIVELLGATVDARQYSIDYATFILLAAPFTTANLVMNQLLRSEGSTTYAMVGMVSGCFLNIALDPLFIRVFGWGVAGAAGATALSKVFSCAVLAIPFVRGTCMLELKLKHFRLNMDTMGEVIRMGVPAFLRMSLVTFGSIVTNNVAKGFGTSALAAISVANKLYRFIASVILGFGQGFSPIAGFCWGARKFKRVIRAYSTTLVMGVSVALVLSAVMFLNAGRLISVFNSEGDAEIARIGSFMLRMLCIGLVPHVGVIVTSNFYQALGRPFESMIMGMSRQILFLIPIVLILPRFFAELGLASAQAMSDILAFLFLALPLAVSMLKKVSRLTDGDVPPFGGVTGGRNAPDEAAPEAEAAADADVI